MSVHYSCKSDNCMPYREGIQRKVLALQFKPFFFFAALQSGTEFEFTIVFGPNPEGMRV